MHQVKKENIMKLVNVIKLVGLMIKIKTFLSFWSSGCLCCQDQKSQQCSSTQKQKWPLVCG